MIDLYAIHYDIDINYLYPEFEGYFSKKLSKEEKISMFNKYREFKTEHTLMNYDEIDNNRYYVEKIIY